MENSDADTGRASRFLSDEEWSRFPGAHWIQKGVADLRRSQATEAAVAVLIAKPRLEGLGFSFQYVGLDIPDPEQMLYDMLCPRHGDEANGAFNAIRQELVSFANAFDKAVAAKNR